MKLKVDKYGRVVLPKKLRLYLNAETGSEIEVKIDEYDGSITFLPIPRGMPVLKQMPNGFPYVEYSRDSTVDFDVVALIKESREERSRHILKSWNI